MNIIEVLLQSRVMNFLKKYFLNSFSLDKIFETLSFIEFLFKTYFPKLVEIYFMHCHLKLKNFSSPFSPVSIIGLIYLEINT